MSNIYYATRVDKNGNKLTSSYTNEKMRAKYGGTDADHREGQIRAKLDKTTKTMEYGEEGMLVRGMLQNSSPPTAEEEGRFVIFARRNGEWDRTPFSFDQYGVANSTMKSMIAQYQSLMIVDMVETEERSGYGAEYAGDNDGPF